MMKFREINNNVFSLLCLFAFAALNAEPLLRFSKTDYYFENIQINNNEQIKIEIINDTGKNIDKFQIMTSCGCLQIKQENLPEWLAEGNNEIPINVEGGLLKDDRKDYTVFLHDDENKVTSTKLHLRFIRPEGWQQGTGGSFFIGKIESWNHCEGKKMVFHFHSKNPDDYDFSIIPHDGNLCFQMQKKNIRPELAEITVVAQPGMNWSPGMNEGVFHVRARHKTGNDTMDTPEYTVIGNLDCGIEIDKIKAKSDSSFVVPIPHDKIISILGTYGKIAFTSRRIDENLSEVNLDYGGRYSNILVMEFSRDGRLYSFKLPKGNFIENRISVCKLASYKDTYRIEYPDADSIEILPLEENQVQIQQWDSHQYKINGKGCFKIIEKFGSYQLEKFYYIADDRITKLN